MVIIETEAAYVIKIISLNSLL